MSSNKEELDRSRLLDYLSVLDEDLKTKITVVAVGGTAMTLINAKPSTLDVDFTIPHESSAEFERVFKMNPTGFKVHIFHDSLIFNTDLTEDYLQRAGRVKTELRNIDLRHLEPLDIIITKIGRLNDRDKEDIMSCVTQFKITHEQISQRASEITYIGGQESYDANLQMVLNTKFE